MTSDYRKYSNKLLREMVQELVIKGVIDYDQRKTFIDAFYTHRHPHYWTEEEKKQARKESNNRRYQRNKLIKLYEQHL